MKSAKKEVEMCFVCGTAPATSDSILCYDHAKELDTLFIKCGHCGSWSDKKRGEGKSRYELLAKLLISNKASLDSLYYSGINLIPLIIVTRHCIECEEEELALRGKQEVWRNA